MKEGQGEKIPSMEEICFQIIAHAGEARSCVFDALSKTLAGDRDAAEQCLAKASDELVVAHKVHMQLLQREASGQQIAQSILLTHAQDILMASLTERELALKMIEFYYALKPTVAS